MQGRRRRRGRWSGGEWNRESDTSRHGEREWVALAAARKLPETKKPSVCFTFLQQQRPQTRRVCGAATRTPPPGECACLRGTKLGNCGGRAAALCVCICVRVCLCWTRSVTAQSSAKIYGTLTAAAAVAKQSQVWVWWRDSGSAWWYCSFLLPCFVPVRCCWHIRASLGRAAAVAAAASSLQPDLLEVFPFS